MWKRPRPAIEINGVFKVLYFGLNGTYEQEHRKLLLVHLGQYSVFWLAAGASGDARHFATETLGGMARNAQHFQLHTPGMDNSSHLGPQSQKNSFQGQRQSQNYCQGEASRDPLERLWEACRCSGKRSTCFPTLQECKMWRSLGHRLYTGDEPHHRTWVVPKLKPLLSKAAV